MSIEINKIYNESCLETMAKMPDNFIDLVITSPPYDNLRIYKGYSFDFESVARELFRTIKQGGVMVWVVGDETVRGSETGTSFRQALYFKEIGFNLHDTMIYLKTGFTNPSHNRYHQVFEFMFVLSKGKPKTFNPIKDRRNKWKGPWGKTTQRQKDGSLKIVLKKRLQEEFGMRFNVWKYDVGKDNSTRDKIAYKHPAIFPERLANDHILSWSNEGDVVYDPFMGSGTTAKMALLNNRKFIGSEISEEYCKIAEKRINKGLLKFWIGR
jgi:site-specific DNA-methyltransferase (adenine-specific)